MNRFSTGTRNRPQRARAGEDDPVGGARRAVQNAGVLCQDSDEAVGERQCLQLAAGGDKRERLAIHAERRRRGPDGSRERRRLELIETAQEQLTGAPRGSDENDGLAVRRHEDGPRRRWKQLQSGRQAEFESRDRKRDGPTCVRRVPGTPSQPDGRQGSGRGDGPWHEDRGNWPRGRGWSAVIRRRAGGNLVEFDPQIPGVTKTPRGVAGEAAAEETAELRRRRIRERRPIRVPCEDRRDRVRSSLALEGTTAGEQLVADAAERPQVGARVDGVTARLLGTHVCRRTKDDAGSGHIG